VASGGESSGGAGPSRFRYHLELTPAQLKLTHTALHSLLNDFGHEQPDVHEVIRQVLDKLPDEHAIRAIRLDDELERGLAQADPAAPSEPPAQLSGDGEPPEEPPDSVA
jgi:hypothetical protein